MKKEFKLPEIKLDNIFKALEDLKQNSSDKALKYHINKVQYQALYNSIMSFSKEELESYTYRFYKEDVLVKRAISTDNSIALAALLNKGVYIQKLMPFSQWLLNNNEDAIWQCFDTILILEKYKDNYEKSNYKSEKDLIFTHWRYLLNEIKDEEQKERFVLKFIQDQTHHFCDFSKWILTTSNDKIKSLKVVLDIESKSNEYTPEKLTKYSQYKSVEDYHIERFIVLLKVTEEKNREELIESFMKNYFSTYRNEILNFLKEEKDSLTIINSFIKSMKENKLIKEGNQLLESLVEFSENSLRISAYNAPKIEKLLDIGFQFVNPEDLIKKIMNEKNVAYDISRYMLAYLNNIVSSETPEEEKQKWLTLYKTAKNVQEVNAIFLRKKLEEELSSQLPEKKKMKI